MNRGRARPAEHGAALVTALLASVVIFILMMALFGTRMTEMRAVTGNVQITQAQLLADAGVDYVLGLISRDDRVLPSSSPYYDVAWRSFNDAGRFQAVADLGPANRLRITSTGEDVRGVRRTVEALLDLEISGSGFPDYAIFTCGPLELIGAMSVTDGNVYSGQTLHIGQQLAVRNGNAHARGRVTFEGVGSVEGNVVSVTNEIVLLGGNANSRRAGAYAANPAGLATLNAPVQVDEALHAPELYELDDYCAGELREQFEVTPAGFDEYRAQAEASGPCVEGDVEVMGGGTTNGYEASMHCVSGNMSITGTPVGFSFENDAVYFIDGDLTISGNFEWPGPGTFVVTGDLVVEGGAQVTSDDFDNVFIVDGDVRIAGTSRIDGLVYTNGTIEGEGTPIINGAVVSMANDGGNGVTGNITVNYRSAATGSPISVTVPSFNIIRWRLVTSP
jgi:hypothetical protein